MRLGVDAREIQDGVVTGIGRSLANFIAYFGAHDASHELALFAEKKLPIPLGPRCREVVIPAWPTFLWDQWRLPLRLKGERIDLFYSPYYKLPLFSPIPAVGQVLDLMYLVFPPYVQALGPLGRLYYATVGRACALKAIAVVTDSDHARGDIIRLWGIRPEKITVIPLGLADRYRPVTDKEVLAAVRQRFGLPDRYLLYLGNFKPHKNVVSLVRAFAGLRKAFEGCKLVLAGPLDAHGQAIQAQVEAAGLAGDVVFTGAIREEDQPEALLSMAELFVFPSLYEGFGIPPLEAMACGVAVVASNRTAIPEVVGDAGLSVDPLDIRALEEAIASLLGDEPLRKRYALKGLKRAEGFRAEQTAGRLYKHIIEIMETKL
ncbi:MAG: glycosyltransferase family 4 protein [Deltaproteobacteria bacterium]|nr:glycosyltransferase family 4 protein [Deltaproteobacteria bacterium]